MLQGIQVDSQENWSHFLLKNTPRPTYHKSHVEYCDLEVFQGQYTAENWDTQVCVPAM